MVKNTGCFRRGPKFSSQYQHGGSQLFNSSSRGSGSHLGSSLSLAVPLENVNQPPSLPISFYSFPLTHSRGHEGKMGQGRPQPSPGLLPALGSQVDLSLSKAKHSPCLGCDFAIAATSLGPTFWSEARVKGLGGPYSVLQGRV